MATTATPYGKFLLNLAQSAHDVLTNPMSLALVTSSYTPDLANDYDWNVQQAFEVVNDSNPGGYLTGGLEVTNRSFAYDSAGNIQILNADDVTWSALNATFRYAVLLDNLDSGNRRMVGLINFGVDRLYNTEPFSVSFPGGLMTFSGA